MKKEKIHQRIERAIDEKVFPGCVIGVYIKNKGRFIFSFGHYTYEKSSPIVKEDTIYDIASITKSIPTSLLLLKLIDEGKIDLNGKLVDYIPEFGNHEGKDKVLIKHLLTYTLDLVVPSMSSLKDLSPDKIVETIEMAPLRRKPGSSFLYTNSTAMLMGLIINRIGGIRLDKLAQEKLFKPLDMNRTTFQPETFGKENIPPTEIDDLRGGIVQGVVHDESTYILQPKYYLGFAGLFSTVPDLLNVLEVVLNKGVKNDIRYFSEDLVNQMSTNQISDLNDFTGLGWQLNRPQWLFMGNLSSERTIGQTGYTGCFVLCDPKNDIAIAMLSNRTFPKRPGNADAINTVRSDLVDIVHKSI